MKVQVVLADTSGVAFYRLINPVTVLQGRGIDIDFSFQWQDVTGPVLDDRGNLVSLPESDYDVVVLSSPQRRAIVDCIPLLQGRGVAVVVEVDDDFFSIDRERHGGYLGFLQQATPEEANFEPLREALEMADLVTVSTEALAKTIPNENVVVLPNCIPSYYMEIELEEDDPRRLNKEGHLVVGWPGDAALHVGSLEVVGNGVVRAVRENDAWFMFIGGDGSTNTKLGFPKDEGIFIPWQPIGDYPYFLRNYDVGIVPLADTAFSRSKTNLKGLEYAALSVPFVASPHPEYRKMNEQGVGLIAGNEQDWHAWISNLLKSDVMREDLIANGLEYAHTQTYDLHAHLWAEAWGRALDIRHTSR